MNLAGAGGEGGAAGAPTDVPAPLTCASFPDDDPSERCEPKLRAILSSNEEFGLLRFEYEAAGRPAAVIDAKSSEALQYYSYDDAGRLTRFESGCGPTRDTCHWHYDFSYGEGGRLQTIDLSYQHTLITYRYRSDGQLEGVDSFSIDDADVLTLRASEVYEYGEDDLLDLVTTDESEDRTEYSYVLEGTRWSALRSGPGNVRPSASSVSSGALGKGATSGGGVVHPAALRTASPSVKGRKRVLG